MSDDTGERGGRRVMREESDKRGERGLVGGD